MPQAGDIIEFGRTKQFKYVKNLGSGGTGDTHLFLDETTNMSFAIKKYHPKDKDHIDDFYNRFVDEIKILFTLSHPHIVRIYNYYLYPEAKGGYLQMEYIDGVTIDEFEPVITDWEDIFTQTISAFRYLEQHGVLHRDIRPANIMIEDYINVKIIDFGFGKQLMDNEDDADSIFLNWPVSEYPEEVSLDGVYNHQSEIYFLGKLFKSLIRDGISSFKYAHIIDKMIKVSPSERYPSFDNVSYDISQGVLGEIDFSESQKNTYQALANSLCGHINHYVSPYKANQDIATILSKLANLIRSSSLEKYIQDNTLLIGAFVDSGYNYNAKQDIPVEQVKEFYKLVNGLEPSKRQIVIDNIHIRLSKIKVMQDITEVDDELPF